MQMTWVSRVTLQAADLRYSEEVLISYLPLSHVAAQVVDIFGPILIGASIYFAQPDALKVNVIGFKTVFMFEKYFVTDMTHKSGKP